MLLWLSTGSICKQDMQEFDCAGCGLKVMKHLSQLTRTDIVFCTLICRNKNFKKANPTWSYPSKKEYTYECLACKKSFSVTGAFNTSTRQYCSKSCRAKHLPRQPHTAETKAKLSHAASLQCKRYKGKHLYTGPKGSIYMKSSWEVKYANWLDAQNQGWTYEPKFTLSNNYIYLPDFQLSDGVIIEIKGYMRPDAEVKWHMFEVEYPQIKKHLLRKEDLVKIGILP